MSDNGEEAVEKMEKAIFISADCWLCVFDLLPADQLGLGIAMISHRFDFYVDEHFKTRKWALKFIRIHSKIGENGTKEMRIVNYNEETLPIAQIQMPRKVIGFERIIINFIDRNAIAFFRRFHPIFTSFCPINLDIDTESDGIAELVMHNIWPLITKNIRVLFLPPNVFHRLRKFAPSFLNDCPSLHVVSLYFDDLFPEFPADDNAMASDGQSVAKWLFTPLQNNVPKMLECSLINNDGNLASPIEPFKAAFANASSPTNFIVSFFADSVVPFDLTNGFTHEQLTLKRVSEMGHFLLVRCPIVREESKWTKWEKETIDWQIRDQWNQIKIDEWCEIGKGLLNATPGPSD